MRSLPVKEFRSFKQSLRDVWTSSSKVEKYAVNPPPPTHLRLLASVPSLWKKVNDFFFRALSRLSVSTWRGRDAPSLGRASRYCQTFFLSAFYWQIDVEKFLWNNLCVITLHYRGECLLSAWEKVHLKHMRQL